MRVIRLELEPLRSLGEYGDIDLPCLGLTHPLGSKCYPKPNILGIRFHSMHFIDEN